MMKQPLDPLWRIVGKSLRGLPVTITIRAVNWAEAERQAAKRGIRWERIVIVD